MVFPPLVPRWESSSHDHDESHDKAEIVVSDFKLVSNLSLAEPPSLIWGIYAKKASYLSYAFEATIAK